MSGSASRLSPGGRVVVIGASLAGLRAVEGLRRGGHDGPIVVIGAEDHLPYDRPPLSKQLLIGKVEPPEVALPLADDLGVEWVLSSAATGLDLGASRVQLADGSELAFDAAVIATGAEARTLTTAPPGEGVHLLRTLDDALALRDALGQAETVAVIGAGFVGLEVAASCRALGLGVTILEMDSAPLRRAVGDRIGLRWAELHREHGVEVRLGATLEGLERHAGGRLEGVALRDGTQGGREVIAADVVVVGVGASPATGWLEGSGIDLDDGVRCDSRLRVLAGGRPLAGVVAAGDVARWDRAGRSPTRVEHWTNAAEQGRAAAAALLDGDGVEPFDPVPYFWSDQFGCKLQMVGTAEPGDAIAVVEGPLDAARFVVAYGRAGRLVAALGMSRPAPVMALGRQIEAGTAFPPGMKE